MSDLRERLIEALEPPWGLPADQGRESVRRIWPIIEAELQKRDQEKARRIDQFKRLAQAERVEADKLPRDAFYRPIKAEHIGASNAYLVAAQMLEEPKP